MECPKENDLEKVKEIFENIDNQCADCPNFIFKDGIGLCVLLSDK